MGFVALICVLENTQINNNRPFFTETHIKQAMENGRYRDCKGEILIITYQLIGS
jgi:hypothetical protein